jgi:hypothetical protein
MGPLSCEKPPLWAAAAAGGQELSMEGLGPWHCLLVTKAGRGVVKANNRHQEKYGDRPGEGAACGPLVGDS